MDGPHRTDLGDGAAPSPAGLVMRRTRSRPVRIAVGIGLVGFTLTGLGTWTADNVDRSTEQRLLNVQTRQVATVLSVAILTIQQPLSTALALQQLSAPSPDAKAFANAMAGSVGASKTFVAASLWLRGATGFVRLTSLGSPAADGQSGQAMQTFLYSATKTKTTVVEQVSVPNRSFIAYAFADPRSGLVVYAERTIPADRRAAVDNNSAFADLNYAIYLGKSPAAAALATTNVDVNDLPLQGRTSQAEVPFGNTVLTVTTSPRQHLGSSLSRWLPLILLASGTFLTVLAAWVAQKLVRARMRAEGDTAIITVLYQQVDGLYEDQRALSVRLQRALLPQLDPQIPNIEVASTYVAGADGIDIGGDWYSVIRVGEHQFAFVVGDVSGRGIDAVATMARARFTLRAYLIDGASAPAALEKCSHQFDISTDGHMITVLAGVGDWRSGQITIANAGHPPPLLLDGDRTKYIEAKVGPPLGTGPSSYASTTFTMPPGATLLSYTDGLIERRCERIDVGLHRLAESAQPLADQPLTSLIATVLSNLGSEGGTDDIAVLTLRRAGET